MLLEVEFFENILNVGTKAFQVVPEILVDVRRICQKLLEVIFRGIVESKFCGFAEDRIRIHFSLKFVVLLEHLRFGLLQNTVQTSQDSKWKNDILILVLFPASTEKFRKAPDQTCCTV